MGKCDRLLNIVQDHARITEFLGQVSCALHNNMPLPNFVPVLHDTLVTDQLSKIAEALNERLERKP